MRRRAAVEPVIGHLKDTTGCAATIAKAATVTCAYRKSHPAILMVQSAQDRTTDNASRVFGGARYRRVLVQ
jgi:hypothetical protein